MAEIVRQCDAGHLRQRARHFHSDRSGANQHEGQQLLDGFRRGVTESGKFLRALKSQQDLAADLVSVLQRRQAGSDLLPLVMPKVVVLNAGGENQEVVRQIILRAGGPAAPAYRRPMTSSSSTSTLRWRLRMERSGPAISSAESRPVAT